MKRGFSLVEVALIMIIVGLLFSAGLGFYLNLIAGVRLSDTKNIIQDVDGAVTSFIVVEGRLPTDGEFRAMTAGIKDAYRNDLVYWAAGSRLGYVDFQSDAGSLCAYNISDTDLVICHDDDCSNQSTTTTINSLAYMVISNGSSGELDTQFEKNMGSPSGRANIVWTVPKADYSGVPGGSGRGQFDDVYSYKTIGESRSLVADCDKYRLMVENYPFPNLSVSGTNNVNSHRLYATGGTGKYYWCVPSVYTDMDGGSTYSWTVSPQMAGGNAWNAGYGPNDGCNWSNAQEGGDYIAIHTPTTLTDNATVRVKLADESYIMNNDNYLGVYEIDYYFEVKD